MTKGKIAGCVVSVVALIGLAIFMYVKFWFVYKEGNNEGDINYFQREGFIFKTYEGKMIQMGYSSHSTGVQSNEFKFSVEDERIAEQINNSPSRQVKLFWKSYLGVLPWRGNSVYVVDSVIPIMPIKDNNEDMFDVPIGQ